MKKWLVLLALIFLTACLPPVNKNKDGGFLTEKPCGPPCFHGITPQISTQDEVLKLIDKPENIFYGCKYFDLTSSGGVKGLTCNYINIRFSNGFVEKISFRPSDKITAQEVIAKYGFPDSVQVFTNKPEHSDLEVKLDFCYDKLPTRIVFETLYSEKYFLKPNSIVAMVSYDSKDIYNYICDVNAKNFYQWNGYGEYLGFPP